MQRFLESRFALVAVCVVFCLAMLSNLGHGTPALSSHGLTPADGVNVAHGASAPPDPWDGVRVAHGASAPPDPWDGVRVAHGASAPPDPWDGVRVAHGASAPPDPWDGARS